MSRLFIHFFLPKISGCDEISRFDQYCLPQQTLFELFFDNFDHSEVLQKGSGEYKDLTDIPFFEFDENGYVESIDMFYEELGGTLQIRYLPSTVRFVQLGMNSFHGRINTTELPARAKVVSFELNCLSGNLDLKGIPSTMQYFSISANKMHGSLDFSDLPRALYVLDVSRNSFEGQIDLRCLKTMRVGNMSDVLYLFWGKNSAKPVENEILMNFSGNSFQGDILVFDVSHVKDSRLFAGLYCRYIVDAKGNKQSL